MSEPFSTLLLSSCVYWMSATILLYRGRYKADQGLRFGICIICWMILLLILGYLKWS